MLNVLPKSCSSIFGCCNKDKSGFFFEVTESFSDKESFILADFFLSDSSRFFGRVDWFFPLFVFAFLGVSTGFSDFNQEENFSFSDLNIYTWVGETL